MKKSFVLYTEIWPAIQKLDMEQRGALFTAIMQHALGEEPDKLDILTDIVFSFIASQMDRADEKYQDVCRRRAEYGRRGGLASAQAKASKSKQRQANQADSDNEPDSDPDSERDSDNEPEHDSENESPKGDSSCIGANARTTKTTKSSWRAPSVDEVQAYCWERSNSVDPEAFVDYYEANGWMVGRSHMKDWKAAVRTWERKETAKGGSSSGMFMAEAERLEREGWS